MAASVIAGSRRRRGWGWLLALATGGVALAGSYFLVLPLFGVLSAVTWSVTGLCWLWVIGVAIVAAARLGMGGARWWAAGWTVLAMLAAAHAGGVFPPSPARPGGAGGGVSGGAAWQSWRTEVGAGFAYYPTRPGPDASIVTAAGDTGSPARELGDGWWWVD